MKHLRLWIALGMFGLVAAVGSAALHGQNQDDQGASGASYVTTFKDSAGNFASRGVITLHADHTTSVIDSGQGGPTFFFTSQLGSWKPDGHGGVLARTLDFDFPPNADVARSDYTISSSQDHSEVTGTITLTTFPLQGDPLDGGGTVIGTFTLCGPIDQTLARGLRAQTLKGRFRRSPSPCQLRPVGRRYRLMVWKEVPLDTAS
jgi:hypothetical protein